jgi:hypothetical protein
MADTKISALASGAPAQAADEYIVARSGANYKLTLTNIAASMPPIGATTPNTGAFTTVTATTANATTVDATNVEVTNVKAKDGTAAISIADSTGAVTVSTKAEFADGSASAPAITNTGDTNTGVYFPAADEVAVAAGGSVAAAFNSNGLFFRNRIINGDMRIDQRNAGAAVTASGGFPVDRLTTFVTTTGAFSAQQDSDAPAGFVNSTKFTVTTAGTVSSTQGFLVTQRVEGTNIADLAWGTASARTVTLSFWVRSSITGTFGGAVSNSAVNRSYPFSYAITSANTWEYKTITIPGDTTGTWLTTTGTGIRVIWGLGVGSTLSNTAGAWAAGNFNSATGAVDWITNLNATWYVTGVQLETGSVATPFERRPYGTELMLCQRYYYRVYGDGTNPQTQISSGLTTTIAQGVTPFPVTLRTRPTALEQSGNAAHYDIGGNVCTAVPAISGATTANTALTVFTTTAVLAAAGAYQSRIINTSGYLGWSAEL